MRSGKGSTYATLPLRCAGTKPVSDRPPAQDNIVAALKQQRYSNERVMEKQIGILTLGPMFIVVLFILFRYLYVSRKYREL